MRIKSIKSKLLAEIRFLNAGRGPSDFYNDVVPVHRGFVDVLPQGTAAMIVTADLQGRETFESAGGQPLRLLGEVLPAMLRANVIPCLGLPTGEIGVFLAGDFYTVPVLDKRGGSGDVRPVGSVDHRAYVKSSNSPLIRLLSGVIHIGRILSPSSHAECRFSMWTRESLF